jgi:hypothetical protein
MAGIITMSNPLLYVPVLKWKRAEHRALKALSDSDKKHIAPLIELVLPTVSPNKDKNGKVKKTSTEQQAEMVLKFKEKRIPAISKEISEFWGQGSIFIDFSLLHNGASTTGLKIDSMNTIIPAVMKIGVKAIPVVNLSDDVKIKEAAGLLCKEYKQGMCVRLVPSDLSDINHLNNTLDNLISRIGLGAHEVDLLIDIKQINEIGGAYLRFINQSQQIRDLNKWRNLIFASGAFPEDLTGCKLDEATSLPRFDWQNWAKHAKSKKLNRLPIYADYTIRTPIFNESLQFYHPTTSIKYATENDWFIMKGKKQEFSLYLVNAKLLVEESGKFYGESYSDGDRYTAEKAKHCDIFLKNPAIKGTGRTEDWISAGINHHLALAVRQVAILV